MLTLSHLHQLFSAETCQTFVFTVRQRGRRGQLLSGVRDHRSLISSQLVIAEWVPRAHTRQITNYHSDNA